MSENSKIEWTDHTFNPWIGCAAVGPGCDNCYAAAWAKRYGRDFAERRRTKTWQDPLRWNARHDDFFATHGRRQRVFCASLADVFDNQVPDEWREDLFELIRTTPDLDWLLLTKRPQNIVRMVRSHGAVAGNGTRYLPDNVCLGTTTEHQPRADQNIPALLRTIPELGVRVTFLSVEPMLGPVQIFSTTTGELLHTSGNDREPGWISWVISGGESGRGARPMHPDWARDVRDQCAAAGVPFLFKQWGEHIVRETAEEACRVCGCTWNNACRGGCYWVEPGLCSACVDCEPPTGDRAVRFSRVGKHAAGRVLDGRTHDGFPEIQR